MDLPTPSPRAYFLTFHTYGTWLPGDERGSVDRAERAYGSPRRGPSPGLVAHVAARMRNAPVELGDAEREVACATFEQVCAYRAWQLFAAHVRTTHAHVVVRAEAAPERVMGALKAYASRRIAEAGLRPPGTRLWARHGSTRRLWTIAAVEAARSYTLNEQGEGLAGAVVSGPLRWGE